MLTITPLSHPHTLSIRPTVAKEQDPVYRYGITHLSSVLCGTV